MASAWSASAEAYTANFQEKREENSPKLDMTVGRKLVVARVVEAMKDKVGLVLLSRGLYVVEAAAGTMSAAICR